MPNKGKKVPRHAPACLIGCAAYACSHGWRVGIPIPISRYLKYRYRRRYIKYRKYRNIGKNTEISIFSVSWHTSTSKCKVLHIGSGNRLFQYELNGHVLASSKEEKDLGVIVTDNLKSSSNCQAAYNKANRVLGMIKRTITYKSPDILLPLYKSLVRPLVEYCTPAWSPHYNKDKVLLEKIQHCFTRMIPGFSQLDYMTRLRLNLWTLEKRRNRSDLIEL